MSLYPGKMVIYRLRPGAVRAGQTEAGAMIKRLYPDGSAELVIYPAMDRDPLFQDRVPQMAKGIEFHCWRLNDDDGLVARIYERIDALQARIEELEDARPLNPQQISQEVEAIRSQDMAVALASGETVRIQDEPRPRRRGKATETA